MGKVADMAREVSDAELITLDEPAAGTGEQWEEFDQFRDQADQGGGGITLWVYRIPTDASGNPVSGAQSSLLFSAPIDRYTLAGVFERVRGEYMPRGYGKATIRMMVRRDKARGVLWNKVFLIEKSAAEGAQEVPNSDPNAGVLGRFVEIMERQRQEQADMLRRALEARPATPPIDPMDMAMRMMTAMTGMVTALNSKPAAATGPVGGGVSDSITAMREMMRFMRDMGFSPGGDAGPDDAEDGIAGILKAASPIAGLLKELVVSARSNPAPRALPPPAVRRLPGPPQFNPNPPPPPPASASAPNPAPVAAPANSEENKMLLATLHEMLGDLVKLAEAGSDPVALGPEVVRMIPEQYDEQFTELLDSDDWFARITAFNPAVAKYQEFFSKLRDSILAQYSADAQEAATPSG